LGMAGRAPAPRAAPPGGGDGAPQRGGARGAGRPRCDDRHRDAGAARTEGVAMNGVHDMGGMHGLGPVEPEPNEPVFHHDWERKAFALTMAAGFLGKWNIDMGRYARELMPGPEYLTTSYYEHWLYGL